MAIDPQLSSPTDDDVLREKLRLLELIRTLDADIDKNSDLIFKPWISHEDQTRHYFEAYQGYLLKAITFSDLPEISKFIDRTKMFEFSDRRQPGYTKPIRDNLGHLKGRISELRMALELNLKDPLDELKSLRERVKNLEDENRRLKMELEAIHRIKK